MNKYDRLPTRILDEVLELAGEAGRCGEVPVGALVVQGDGSFNVIGRGRNRILELHDPSAHAELLAVRDACKTVGSERLSDCALVSSLEPCAMCSGGIILARLETVVYFAPTGTGIGIVDFLRLSRDAERPFNHYPEVRQETAYADGSARLLKAFFASKRLELAGDSGE